MRHSLTEKHSFSYYRKHTFLLSISYWLPRLLTLKFHGYFIAIDSAGYRTNTNSFGFTHDLASINLIGDSFRPFPVNFLYAIFPNDLCRIWFQLLLNYLSWILIFRVMCRRSGSSRISLVFICSLVLYPVLVQSDLTILPESLSLSVALIIVALILGKQLHQKRSILLIFFLVLILCIQRPTMWLTFLALSFIIFIFKARAIKHFGKKVSLALFTICLSCSLLGALYNDHQSTSGWPKSFQSSLPVTKDGFPIGLLIWPDNPLHDSWTTELHRDGYPSCARIRSSDLGPYEYTIRVFGTCKEANTWLSKNFPSFYLTTFSHNPILVVHEILLFFPYSFVSLSSIRHLLFAPFINVGIALFPYLVMMFLIFAIGFRRNTLRNFSLQNQIFALAILFSMTLPIFVNTLVMPSDSFRHSEPTNILCAILIFWIASKDLDLVKERQVEIF
jgi:hypothetical protein